ncbi:MAG TPA: cell division protein ZapA [Bacteroidia bacterium]|nr:cell division protein ZapA [Bacteroidia bacterium]
MSEKSVKITIAGRTYPLTVDAKEEQSVLDAAKRINDRVAQLETTYLVKDKQDLLAMTALQFASQYLDKKSKTIDNQDDIIANLTHAHGLIDSFLAGKPASA